MNTKLGLRLIPSVLVLGALIAWASFGVVGCGADTVPDIAAPTAPTSSTSEAETGETHSEPGQSTTAPSAAIEGVGAAISVANRQEIATVNAARRLEEKYGTRWSDVVDAWRAVWIAQGKENLRAKADLLLDTDEVDRLKRTVPHPSSAQENARATFRREKWTELRNKIRQRGTAPLPPTYDALTRVAPEQKAEASISSAHFALEHLTDRMAMAIRRGTKTSVGLGPLLMATPLLQSSCFANCQSLASDLIELLYEICTSAYHSCCDDIGPCYAGSSARATCLDEYYECTDDAVDDYYDWYDRCTDRC